MHTFTQIILLMLIPGLMSSFGQNTQQQARGQQPTVVYLVRHAEKKSSGHDPGLTKAGMERARALSDYFEQIPVAGLFASPYRRTRQTLEPLARAKGLTIREYSTRSLEALPETVAREFAGKTVVIAGHSNTLLETMEAFNLKRPLAELTEQDYHYLFKITLQDGKAPEVEVLHYGKPGAE